MLESGQSSSQSGGILELLTEFSPARELTLEAASAGLGRTINSRPSSRDLNFTQVKKLLESRLDREVLEGLRRVISVGQGILDHVTFLISADDVPFQTMSAILF